MGLKILHSADWHLDSSFSRMDAERKAFLREELKKVPRKIGDLCRREGCDLVLLSGDLFDGLWSRESVHEVYRALEEMVVPVFISPGNHDFCSLESPWLRVQWPENVHIFRNGLEYVDIPQLDCRVYGAGYQSMDCPGLLEGFRAEGAAKYRIALLHADPIQLNSPYCPVTAAQVRDSGLDYLALGHIHKAGSFRAGKTLCAWPGCPMGRGFDETREKGVYIVSLEENASVAFVLLDTPRFYELEADAEELGDVLPPVADSHFYRVRIQGTSGADLKNLQEEYAAFANLQLIDERVPETDLWEHAGEDTLEGTFLSLLREKLENAEQEEAELVTLAAELSRKLLEGRTVELP